MRVFPIRRLPDSSLMSSAEDAQATVSADSLMLSNGALLHPGHVLNRAVLEPATWEQTKRTSSPVHTRLRVFSGTSNQVRPASPHSHPCAHALSL